MSFVRELFANAGSGALLAAGAPRSATRFTYSLVQAVALLLLWNAVLVATEYANAGAAPRFQASGILGQAIEALCIVVACYIIALVENEKAAFPRLVVLMSSVILLPLAVAYLVRFVLAQLLDPGAANQLQSLIWLIFTLWLAVAAFRAVRLQFNRGLLESAFLALVAMIGFVASALWFPTAPVWRPPGDPKPRPAIFTQAPGAAERPADPLALSLHRPTIAKVLPQVS